MRDIAGTDYYTNLPHNSAEAYVFCSNKTQKTPATTFGQISTNSFTQALFNKKSNSKTHVIKLLDSKKGIMELHNELLKLRQQEKELGSQIIDKLQMMENGRKYIGLGYSSLFDYLVRGLGYSDSMAYQKQSCVRLCKEMPELKTKIDKGELTLSGLTVAFKVLKHKSTVQKREWIQKLENKSSREIKSLVTQQEKAPPVKIRTTEYSDIVHLRLELSLEQFQKIKRLQALLSHSGDLEMLIENLVDKGLKNFEKTNFRKSKSTNPRFVSKSLRNHLLKRANYRCQQPGCESHKFLQIDHKIPVRAGGTQAVDNLQVLCSTHNRWKG